MRPPSRADSTTRGRRSCFGGWCPPTAGPGAYVDGRLASAATLAELGAELVDLHGQHEHQSLLRPVHQRAALDRFGDVDLALLMEARVALADLNRRRAELGGDERSRAREIELCRFQLAELDEAGLENPDEEEALKAEEAVLSDRRGQPRRSPAGCDVSGCRWRSRCRAGPDSRGVGRTAAAGGSA